MDDQFVVCHPKSFLQESVMRNLHGAEHFWRMVRSLNLVDPLLWKLPAQDLKLRLLLWELRDV
jgi:hypothetical protein